MSEAFHRDDLGVLKGDVPTAILGRRNLSGAVSRSFALFLEKPGALQKLLLAGAPFEFEPPEVFVVHFGEGVGRSDVVCVGLGVRPVCLEVRQTEERVVVVVWPLLLAPGVEQVLKLLPLALLVLLVLGVRLCLVLASSSLLWLRPGLLCRCWRRRRLRVLVGSA